MEVDKTENVITTVSISGDVKEKGVFLAKEIIGTTTLSSIISFLIKREFKKIKNER